MPEKPKHEGPERRDRYRIKVETKALVEVGGRSEVATIENMTRNGLFFRAFREYHRGMLIRITFPYDPAQTGTQTPQFAEVVRIEHAPGSLKKGVAVKLLNVFLKL